VQHEGERQVRDHRRLVGMEEVQTGTPGEKVFADDGHREVAAVIPAEGLRQREPEEPGGVGATSGLE
jgi:hypothetical protein